MLCPQNGVRIVAVDFVTSFHPMYCIYALKVARTDGLMLFLVACHCTSFIVNLLLCYVLGKYFFFSPFIELMHTFTPTLSVVCTCICAWASAHRGKWSQLTPTLKMDEKLKSENMQKEQFSMFMLYFESNQGKQV